MFEWNNCQIEFMQEHKSSMILMIPIFCKERVFLFQM